jgi:hypothetical protein
MIHIFLIDQRFVFYLISQGVLYDFAGKKNNRDVKGIEADIIREELQ